MVLLANGHAHEDYRRQSESFSGSRVSNRAQGQKEIEGEGDHFRNRYADARLMPSSLAISSGFIPDSFNSRMRAFLFRAFGGLPHSAFFFRDAAIPDFTLWTMFSRSNCAKTARMPAINRPI